MRLLLDSGADVNAKDNFKNTVLHMAAAFGNLKMAKFLFANGVDVTAKDRNGNTALGSAIYKGHLEVAELLVANGADVNTKFTFMWWGMTALQVLL